MDQTTLGFEPLHKKTRKEIFFEEIDAVVPWGEVVTLIAPHARGAHQALSGRPPFAVETMLRIHCLQLRWHEQQALDRYEPAQDRNHVCAQKEDHCLERWLRKTEQLR